MRCLTRGVMGSSEPARVEVFVEPDGMHARLRRNVTHDTLEADGMEADVWTWDEAVFPSDAGIAELEGSFEALWEQAEDGMLTDSERMARLAEQASILEGAIVELAEIIGGDE